MRKNDLIKKLQEIEGNPEICLWNGLVGDWMPVDKLAESYLCKITQNYWIQAVESEEKITRRDFEYSLPQDEVEALKKQYKKMQWEDNEFVTEEDVKEKRYKTKRIVYVCAGRRGVSTFDRLGDISY